MRILLGEFILCVRTGKLPRPLSPSTFLMLSSGIWARHLGHATRRCNAETTSKGAEPGIVGQLLQNNQIWCQGHCWASSLACISIRTALGKRKSLCSCEDLWGIDELCCGESFRFFFGTWSDEAISSWVFKLTRGTYTDGYFSVDFLLLDKLTGERCVDEIGEGINADMEWIERLAAETYDPFISHELYTCMILPEFMTGTLEKADEYFEKASQILECITQPFYYLQLRVFSGGLVKFHMFLASSSADDKQRHMARGKELMTQYDAWASNSMAVFEARQAILQALYLECKDDAMEEIESAYETAIDSAHHHGNIVDLAYAYFFLARYEAKIGRPTVANRLAIKSYAYFKCWGANALVKVVKQQFNLSIDGDPDELITGGSKRSSDDL